MCQLTLAYLTRPLPCPQGWPTYVYRQYASSKNALGPNSILVDADDYQSQKLEELAFKLNMNHDELVVLQGLANRIGITTMSTAYSGIDAPGSSMLSLVAALSGDFELDVHHPEHLFAIEWNDSCQVELQIHPACANCVFTDVSDFLHPMLRDKMSDLQSNNQLTTVLLPVVRDTPRKAMVWTFGLLFIRIFVTVTDTLCIFVYINITFYSRWLLGSGPFGS